MAVKSSKLNPLRTKHNIEITIDDTPFKLVFKPVNKHIQEKLDALKDKNVEQYENLDSKRAELKEIKDLKAVNDELLKVEKLENRAEILFENKSYISQISSLEKDIKNIDKTLEDVNTAVETYYKTAFEECITGEDKVKFQNAIDEAGISYIVVNSYISEAVRESQEKK